MWPTPTDTQTDTHTHTGEQTRTQTHSSAEEPKDIPEVDKRLAVRAEKKECKKQERPPFKSVIFHLTSQKAENFLPHSTPTHLAFSNHW